MRHFPPPLTTTNKGHGRVEQRSIEVADISKRLLFPYARQAMRITRTRIVKGQSSTQLVYAISSHPAKKASPETLLALNRDHWQVENKLHYVKDVSLNEDRRYHRKNPALFASLNNLIISLVRLAGSAYIPTAQRHFRAFPAMAIRAIGLTL